MRNVISVRKNVFFYSIFALLGTTSCLKGGLRVVADPRDSVAPLVALSSSLSGVYKGSTTRTIHYYASDEGAADPDAVTVSLSYSADGGSTWVPIASGLEPDGSYDWTMPAIDSSQVRVKVTGVDAAGNEKSVISPAFSVDSSVPSIAMISPEAGSSFTNSGSTTLSWSASDGGAGLDNATVEYSTNNGDTWTTVYGPGPNTGSANWNLPNVNSPLMRIRITAPDLAGNINTYVSPMFSVGQPALSIDLAVGYSTSFETVTVGKTSYEAEFRFSNRGTAGTTCAAPSLTGTDANQFTITSDGCGTANADAHSSCTIKLRATPTSAGSKSATLSRVCGTATPSVALSMDARSNAVSIVGMDGRFSTGTCILDSDGALRCWGSGVIDTGRYLPTRKTWWGGVQSFSVGWAAACAVFGDNSVQCWGQNSNTGVLGNGTTTDSYYSPVVVTGLSATKVTVGSGSACAILPDQTAKCWGANTYGQVGRGDTVGPVTSPVAVSGLSGVADISAAGGTVCALLSDGTGRCWGRNTQGELGNGTQTDSSTPVVVSGLVNATKISTGYNGACALISNGTIKCWGSGGFGLLGNGSNSMATTPVLVSGITNAIDVRVSGYHACAVLADATMRCWGRNNSGQLGNGTRTDSNVPVNPGLTGVTFAVPGNEHTCAVLGSNGIKCWGFETNYGGTVADGIGNNAYRPFALNGVNNAQYIKSGWQHACALMADQTVKCWGSNYYGPLGNSVVGESNVPVAIAGLSGVSQLEVGGSTNCVLLADKTAKCWGMGYYGHLGDNTGNSNQVPQTVYGLTNIKQLALGGQFGCALLEAGTVHCWGSNTYGVIGDGGAGSQRNAPAQVLNVSNAVAISAGAYHACALLADGTAKCWGQNTSSQLGIGTSGGQALATAVVGLTGAVDLKSGGDSNCARKADHSLWCWGKNGYSELTSSGQKPSAFKPAGYNDIDDYQMSNYSLCVRFAGNSNYFCTGLSRDFDAGVTNNQISSPVRVLTSGLIAMSASSYGDRTYMKKADGTWLGIGYNPTNTATTDSFPSQSTFLTPTALSGF